MNLSESLPWVIAHIYSRVHFECYFFNLKLNRDSSALGLFCHVQLKRDRGNWEWRWKLNDVPNAIGYNMKDSSHTFEWVMPHIRMSHVTHINESCHTYQWVTFKPDVSKSRVTHEWAMSHIYMIHVSHIKSHAYIWLSHVPRMNESCPTYERDI